MLPSVPQRSGGEHDAPERTSGPRQLNGETLRRWLLAAATALHEQRDYLTQLDRAIGDADHATNMDRGFAAVAQQLKRLETTAPREVLTSAGSTLVSTVGGASGPIWGMALRRAGSTFGEVSDFGAAELADALDAALAGVVELGSADVGDKTMVDALAPAVHAFRERLERGAPLSQAAAAARAAAEEGARSTVSLRATKGRASYLGERSVGHEDPGAASTAIIVAALEEALATA
jgi:phosphoenolpyruvate---glycerone phosphotransferase subunit DhaL